MSARYKAYEVERVSRCVTTILVYAHDAQDAKRRSAEHGEAQDAEYEARGFAGVRRDPDRDRPAPQKGDTDHA